MLREFEHERQEGITIFLDTRLGLSPSGVQLGLFENGVTFCASLAAHYIRHGYEVELVTGRTHQIRVHLSYIGHAVVGDGEYGRIGEMERELGLERQFLHAYKISFPHPVSGNEISLEQPLPHDLQSALERLHERG